MTAWYELKEFLSRIRSRLSTDFYDNEAERFDRLLENASNELVVLKVERDAFSRRAIIAEQNERDAAGEWRAKCERLTAERDEARAVLARASNGLNAVIGGLTADLERAEADNAALLERMRAMETWVAKAVKRISGFAHADACNVEDHYDKEETEGCVCALALLDGVPGTAGAEASTPPVSELDGLEGEMAEDAAFDRMANPGLSPEPTTAEAFATVREALDHISEGDHCIGPVRDALSLLERRMGEVTYLLDGRNITEWASHARVLEQALRGVLEHGGKHTVAGIDAWNFARSLLSGVSQVKP